MLFFRKYYILLLVQVVFSAQVSINQADLIARNFINKELDADFQVDKIEKQDMIYIVNLSPSGFILISIDNLYLLFSYFQSGLILN